MKNIFKESKNYKYSIIIPCYNAAPYIAQAIRSCLNQSYGNYEIIVVNDGSTDSSKRVINCFDIRYFEKENGGPASAMNYGIEQATGDIICFAAADDAQSPDKLEIFNKAFQEKIDFCYSGYNHANKYAYPWEYVSPAPLTPDNIKKNICMSGGAIAAHNYVFDKIKFRELPFNEDQWWAWDIYRSKYKYAMIDLPTFNYRLISTGISYSKKKLVEENVLKCNKEIDDEQT